jgi:anhydro-N-acetylmuramic acid kinase
LLRCMLEDPYFELEPPKSTGFEYFNLGWLSRFDVDQYDAADVQATLCELSASSIAASLSSCVRDAGEVFVCGGGVRNSELMSRLRQNLPTSTVASTTAVGLDPDWVEAVAFAWLAMRTLNGETGNLPSVTGASHKVVLGDIHSF